MSTPSPTHLACLCAGWCRLCDDYRERFEQVAGALSAQLPLRAHWIDIEEESELVGDVDVDTFPTIVVIDAAGRVRFAGAVTPAADALERLLRATLLEGTSAKGDTAPGVTPDILAFAERLNRRD